MTDLEVAPDAAADRHSPAIIVIGFPIGGDEHIAACNGKPDETISTRCGGQGVVIVFGMAKPVKTPLIGPTRAP